MEPKGLKKPVSDDFSMPGQPSAKASLGLNFNTLTVVEDDITPVGDGGPDHRIVG